MHFGKATIISVHTILLKVRAAAMWRKHSRVDALYSLTLWLLIFDYTKKCQSRHEFKVISLMWRSISLFRKQSLNLAWHCRNPTGGNQDSRCGRNGGWSWKASQQIFKCTYFAWQEQNIWSWDLYRFPTRCFVHIVYAISRHYFGSEKHAEGQRSALRSPTHSQRCVPLWLLLNQPLTSFCLHLLLSTESKLQRNTPDDTWTWLAY